MNDQLKSTIDLNEKKLAHSQTNYNEQLATLDGKLKSFEELIAKTIQDKTTLYTTEVTNLKKQIETISNMHLNQINQLNNLQQEKMKSLNEQIYLLQNQQVQKDKLIQQSNNLASQYQKQLIAASSTTSLHIVAIIIALIAGIILGAFILN